MISGHRTLSGRVRARSMAHSVFQVFLGAILTGVLLLGMGGTGPARAEGHLTLVVHPYLSTSEIETRFTPLANRLKAALGRDVKIQISETYEQHVDILGQGGFDIAYLGPVSYVSLHDKYGPQHLLARQADHGQAVFHGFIVVREDSPFHSLSDLKGKQFAFGSWSSTMSHVVPHVMLYNAGVGIKDLAGYDFVGGHKDVAISVLAGKFDAGGVKAGVYEQYKDRGLRALAVSDAISEHLFVAGDNLDPALRDRIRTALLSLHKDADGLAALTAIKSSITALVPVVDQDYDTLRQTIEAFERTKHDHEPRVPSPQ